MPRLSKTMRDRLFSGYGPLSSFFVRIDVAYAMDAYPESMKRDLHAIRAVRNKFAHPSMGVHFDDADVVACFLKFADYSPATDKPFDFFLKKSNACMAELNRLLSSQQMIALLRAGAPDSSPKKSE